MNAKYLGAFLLLSTQLEWAESVFANNDFNDLKGVGLNDGSFLGEFYSKFTDDTHLPTIREALVSAALTDPQKTPGMKDIHRKLFKILALTLAANAPNYTNPPCPRKEALESIIAAVNNAQADMAGK